jgi:hypothetical protein
MINPNEYDDDAYVKASNDLIEKLPQLLDALWQAGAELKDIAEDITGAFESCDSDLASSRLKVEISGP